MFGWSFTTSDLIRAIWAGVFAFIGTFIALDAGIWKAPNLGAAKAAAIALIPLALAAAFDAFKNALLADGSRLKG